MNLVLQGISSSSRVDINADRFYLSAQTTNVIQQDAVNRLIKDLKDNSLWPKMSSIYLFLTTAAANQRINAFDTTIRNITFNGGATYTLSGYTPNGTNGFANTGTLVTSTNIPQDSVHLALYSRTNVLSGTSIDFGCNSTTPVYLYMRTRDGSNRFDMSLNSGLQANLFSNSDSSGFFVASRTASNRVAAFRNGVFLGSGTTASTGRPAVALTIGGLNNNGTVQNFSSKQFAYASIGTGLTDAECLTYNTIIQRFQTTLGRNV